MQHLNAMNGDTHIHLMPRSHLPTRKNTLHSFQNILMKEFPYFCRARCRALRIKRLNHITKSMDSTSSHGKNIYQSLTNYSHLLRFPFPAIQLERKAPCNHANKVKHSGLGVTFKKPPFDNGMFEIYWWNE